MINLNKNEISSISGAKEFDCCFTIKPWTMCLDKDHVVVYAAQNETCNKNKHDEDELRSLGFLECCTGNHKGVVGFAIRDFSASSSPTLVKYTTCVDIS